MTIEINRTQVRCVWCRATQQHITNNPMYMPSKAIPVYI